MKESNVRLAIAWAIFLIHFSAIGLLLYYWLSERAFLDNEATTALLIMAPLTAGHLMIAIRWTMQNRFLDATSVEDRAVRLSAVLMSIIIPALFALFLLLSIRWKVHGTITNFESFKTVLGVLETVFGAFITVIMNTWYEKHAS